MSKLGDEYAFPVAWPDAAPSKPFIMLGWAGICDGRIHSQTNDERMLAVYPSRRLARQYYEHVIRVEISGVVK